METFKNHKGGWPIPLFYGIPSTDFLKHCVTPKKAKHPSSNARNYSLLSLFPKKMSTKIHAYIFAISEIKNYTSNTKHHSLFLLQRYIEKKGMNFNENVQLLALVSFFISSKIYEVSPLKIEELHKFSSHAFTNKDIISAEHRILETLDYKIFLKKYLISDKLEVFILLLSSLHPTERIEELVNVSNLILDLLYENILIFESFNSQKALIASILHASLIVLTQYNGRFPMTWRMAIITKIPEEEIISGAIKLLKHILPKDFRRVVKLE